MCVGPRRYRAKSHGKSLLLVLLLALLISSIFFVWTISIQTPILVLNRISAQQRAENATTYCTTRAQSFYLEKKTAFASDIYWGKESGFLIAPDNKTRVKPEVKEEEFATLTFEKGDGKAPYSVNNLNGTSVVIGWNGRLVPPGAVDLVSVGHFNGLTSVGEVLLLENSFPFSVAAAGTLKASNLEVYAVPSSAAFDDGSLTDDEKLPGSLLSNSLVTGAVTLGGTSEVRGDVTTRGTVVTTDSAKILGDTITANEPQTIPDIKATQFDPTGQRFVGKWSPGDGTVDGARIHEGDLTLSEDLKFEDGLLYVKGNITVTGTLKGKGALVATGDIHITTGQMDLANDVNAMVAGGNITIDGLGPSNSTFKGIVFAEKSIEFKRTTVVGASISSDPNGSVTMTDVKAVTAPRVASLLIEKDVKLEEAMKSAFAGFLGGNSQPTGILVNDTDFTALDRANEEDLKALAAGLDPAKEGTGWKVVVRTDAGPPAVYKETGGFDFLDAQTNWRAYVKEKNTGHVDHVTIFDLDLNKVLSVAGQISVKYRRMQTYSGS